MKRRRIILLAIGTAVVLTTAAWLAYAHYKGRRSTKVAALFGGDSAVDVILYPDKVEARRIGPIPPLPNPRQVTLADFPTLAGPAIVPDPEASEVAEALASPESYLWDVKKGCIPNYGVRLTFARGGERIDVLLCFECNILAIYRNGRVTGGEDFDPIRPVLVQAALAAFPYDPTLRKL